MDRHVLEKEVAEVVVGGRTFRLEEMSGARHRAYVKQQVEASLQVVREVADDESFWTGDRDLPDVLEALGEKSAAQETACFRDLLTPTDGLPAPDDAWLDEHLTSKMRVKVLDLQSTLNGSKELAGNLLSLLEQARARREARTITDSAGPS